MKPQPMTGPEIDEVWSDEIGYDASFSERTAIQRLIAARDAQWAAMIGEPVAWRVDFPPELSVGRRRFYGDDEWSESTARHLAISHAAVEVPLYAIKETP